MHKLKVVIKGYFGYDNIGDDAILEAMIDSIRSEIPKAEIVILCSNPTLIADRYKVRAISSALKRNFYVISKELFKSDVFILGGGGLFSNDSPLRILSKLLYLFMAKFLCVKKIVVYSVGVDPLINKLSRLLMRIFLNHCVSILSVRDTESALVLKKAGIKKEIFVYYDPAFSLPNRDEDAERILRSVGISFDIPYMVIAIAKPWNLEKEPDKAERYASFLSGCSCVINMFMDAHPGLNVVFIPFFYPYDLEVALEIFKNINNKNTFHILYLKNKPKIVKSIIGHSSIVLGMRYHSVVFSISTSTPLAAISYGPKIDSLLKKCSVIQYSERLGIRKSDFFKEEKDVDFGSLYNKLEEVYVKRELVKSLIEEGFLFIKGEMKPIGKLLKEILVFK